MLKSQQDVELRIGGWTRSDAARHCFRFPVGTILDAGERVVVHTGAGENEGQHYCMGRGGAVWNNDGDEATLFNEVGATVLVFRY